MKHAILILATLGYVFLLIAGLDTGLGVYRAPIYCLAASVSAVIAAAYTPKRQKWFWSIAGIVAVAGAIYGYQQNSEWRERLERVRTRQPPTSASQSEANR